jgi:hypothetical protein
MAMKIPQDLATAIDEDGADLGFACDADGTVTGGFETGYSGTPYPPPGVSAVESARRRQRRYVRVLLADRARGGAADRLHVDARRPAR